MWVAEPKTSTILIFVYSLGSTMPLQYVATTDANRPKKEN